MIFYYLCFASVLALQLGTHQSAGLRYLCIGVAMFLIAALRSDQVDLDYKGYVDYYNDVLDAGFSNVEPTFILLSHLIKNFTDETLPLFIFYAALGITLKLVGIAQLSKFPLASLLVYFSGFFLLWEMTQIRAAVAGGLLLLCVSQIRHRRLLAFLGLWGLAVSFHYAALILLPLYFLRSDSASAWIYYLLLPLATASYMANVNLVELASFAPIQLIELKIKSYETYADADVDNIYNAVYLSRCSLALLLFANRDFLSRQNEYFIVMLKIYFVALFIHVALASIPGISSRLSELLMVVEVILIPMLIHFFRSKLVGHTIVVLAGLTFFVFSLHYTQLLMPYGISSLVLP